MDKTLAEDIDKKVNEYWDKLVEIDKIDMHEYMNLLKNKYGENLEIYEKIISIEKEFTLEETKEIYDHIYSTGLYKDYSPIHEFYRRETLKILLDNLQNKKIIEMGCGDGRMAVGLALFGNNNVYGIDMNENAVKIAENKKNEYPEISNNITFLKANYTAEESYDKIKQKYPEGVDTILFIQPDKAWLYARHEVNKLLNPAGSTVISLLHNIQNENPEMEKIRINDDWEKLAKRAGMNYEIIKYTPFHNRRAILVGEMKR